MKAEQIFCSKCGIKPLILTIDIHGLGDYIPPGTWTRLPEGDLLCYACQMTPSAQVDAQIVTLKKDIEKLAMINAVMAERLAESLAIIKKFSTSVDDFIERK